MLGSRNLKALPKNVNRRTTFPAAFALSFLSQTGASSDFADIYRVVCANIGTKTTLLSRSSLIETTRPATPPPTSLMTDSNEQPFVAKTYSYARSTAQPISAARERSSLVIAQANRSLNPSVLLCLLTILASIPSFAGGTEPTIPNPAPPNIVLIFADDLGYGDLGCFNNDSVRTPNIDKLASQGTLFTDFYVPQAVCTASRAALMTGCYANRVGLAGALNHTSTSGIHPNEKLLPEILHENGYATGMFGKWHLGLPPYFSPLKNGFDRWFGIPYSNDNSKYHPVLADSMPPLPLYQDEKIIETDSDQKQFTKRITEHSIEFIDANAQRPFFLYVPHIMPHVPIFASDDFRGKSSSGLYGDCIEELDWSVGQILSAIERHQLSDKTLIIFTSDNGPFISYGKHAGSAGVLREGKLTSFEGGVRVPTVMHWPGKIPAGRKCSTPLMTIDLLPTFCSFVGASLPGHTLDGKDVSQVLFGNDGALLPRPLAFYSGTELHAVRQGKWKLHFPHKYLTVIEGEPRDDGKPAGFGTLKPKSITESGVEGIASRHGYRVAQLPLSLFDLQSDPGEQTNVADQHPDIVRELQEIGEAYRQELGDSLSGQLGTGVRPAGNSQANSR